MNWHSIIPPLIAVLIIFWKKEVIGALLVSIIVAEFLIVSSPLSWIQPFMALTNSIERSILVIGEPNNARILAFALLIGVLMNLMQFSGGISATVTLLIKRRLVDSQRRAGLAAVIIGSFIFVSTYVSAITTGILCRGLFDKFGMSRARLAYLIDSTCAPICLLLMFNVFGAYLLSLLQGYSLKGSHISILMESTLYNFYPILALVFAYYTAFTGKTFGPLRKLEKHSKNDKLVEQATTIHGKARYMVLPVIVLVFGVFGVLYWTGDGQITKGSGSKSVLYAIVISTILLYAMLLNSKKHTHNQLLDEAFVGISQILPLFIIILLSITFGASLKILGTGVFVAGYLEEYLPAYLIVPMFFITAGLMSFSTGSSFGTFAVLVPMAVPLIEVTGIPASFLIASIISGGAFGDHSSPISDTSMVSSLAAGCTHIEHVKTQLPYGLVAGGLSFLLFFIFGFFVIK